MKKILLIEDNISLSKMYMEKLHMHGFEVLGALDGEEGFNLALKHHPDLIVLDVIMPKMDGMTVMKKLRQDPWGRSVPIILLTNVRPDADKTIQAVVKDHPAYYLLKDVITPESMVDKVKEVLDIS